MMDTSSRSLFPATTIIEFSEVVPEQSRWIFGGSGDTEEALGTWERGIEAFLQSPHRIPQARSQGQKRPRGPNPALLPQLQGSRPHLLPHTQRFRPCLLEQCRSLPCLGTYSTLISGRQGACVVRSTPSGPSFHLPNLRQRQASDRGKHLAEAGVWVAVGPMTLLTPHVDNTPSVHLL